jgi:hypothetical protein
MSAQTATKTPAKPVPVPAADGGFRPWHFFVLASLIAATVAVMMAHGTSAANLILISLTIGAAGAAGFGFHRTFVPLVSEEPPGPAPLGDRAKATLEREKARVLRTIKELEFDRAMGKLSAQDFDEMVARLRARAIVLMKQLDQGSDGYRELIERELRTRLGAPAPAVAPAPAPLVAGTCLACGAVNDADARFCKQCGKPLERP